jgi:hypothetical protein
MGLAAMTITASGQSKHPSDGNGIYVAPPKLFDSRGLYHKFTDLQGALSRLVGSNGQATFFFDRATLASALNAIQAYSSSQSQTSAGINLSLPTTPFTNTNTSNISTGTNLANGVTTNTGSTSNTDTSTHTTQQAAPTAPGLPTISVTPGISAPSGSPALGAQDTLAEETELSYEILNLSLIFERSIDDRVMMVESDEVDSHNQKKIYGDSRLQGVMGLDISLTPKYSDAIAEVTVSMTTDTPKEGDSASVVEQFPRQRTYNAATFASRTSGFSIGTTFSVIGLSAGSQNASAKSYIAKDFDTVAFEKAPDPMYPAGKTVSFGWQFRPVLNRHIIDPGKREVFVALALPTPNLPYGDVAEPLFCGTVHVKTVWRKYCTTNGMVGGIIPGSDTCQDMPKFKVYSVTKSEEALGPQIHDVESEDAGGGNVLVSLIADNLSEDTSVTAGTTRYAAQSLFDGSVGDRRLRFLAPAKDIAINRPQIIGDYNVNTPIQYSTSKVAYKLTVRADKTSTGECSYIKPIDAATTHVHIVADVSETGAEGNRLKKAFSSRQWPTWDGTFNSSNFRLVAPSTNTTDGQNKGTTAKEDLPRPQPLLVATLGDIVYGLSDHPFVTNLIKGGITLDFDVPTKDLQQYRSIKVQQLLVPQEFNSSYTPTISSAFTVSGVALLSSDAKHARIAITGTNLIGDNNQWVYLTINGQVIGPKDSRWNQGLSTDQAIVIDIEKSSADTFKELFVKRAGQLPVIMAVDLKVPASVPPAKAPDLALKDPGITVGDVPTVTWSGTLQDKVASVSFDGTDQVIDKGSHTVLLTSAFTAKPGKKTLAFLDTAGKKHFLSLTVAASASPAAASGQTGG